MAERRCFSEKVVCSDAFLSLPNAAQCLYVQLCMRADEDGFINSPVSAIRSVKAKSKDLRILIDKRFLLELSDGLLLVKHWRISNTLKNDRAKPVMYPSAAASVYIKANKSYTDHPVEGCKTLLEYKQSYVCASGKKRIPNGFQPDSSRIPNGFPAEPNRAEPNRAEPNRAEPNRAEPKGMDSVWDGELAESFDVFWGEYPKRSDRTGAWEQWLALRPDKDLLEKILSGLDSWKRSKQWAKDGGWYISKASKWLSERQWEYPPEPAGCGREPDEDEVAAIRRMMEADDG